MNHQVAWALVLVLWVAARAAVPVFYQNDFEGPEPLNGWGGAGRLAVGHQGQGMIVQIPAGKPATATASLTLPVEKMRGCTVNAWADVRAQDVTLPPRPWNGVKFMLVVESPSGKDWPAENFEGGSFDWRRAAFSTRIPADATRVQLVLGLEQVTGTVWFDNVRIAMARTPAIPEIKPFETRHVGHNLPRLRGAMVAPNIDEAGLRTLGQEWNANTIRWQIIRYVGREYRYEPAEYERWLEGELKRLDAVLPLCRKYGLMVVVDLHSPPGGKRTVSGYVGSDAGLFSDRRAQEHFVEVWRKIARRYKGQTIIWGYDLANEPVEGVVGEDCLTWRELADRAAKAVHEIEPERTIIVEPADWGGPAALANLVPLQEPNVVYSVHMYVPAEFTHQSVHGGEADVVYPGPIKGEMWDKARLEKALAPVVEFQRKYNVHIYIGEFSAIRWAPDNSAYRYLKDVIEILEANGWDWAYHAFREWHGWSVEHDENRAGNRPASTPTDRQKLLTEWYGRNSKPQVQ